MTYCVGVITETGLVMLADTRTNAGLDNIATYTKLHTFETPGERMIALASAGNLSISQSALHLLRTGVPQRTGATSDDTPPETKRLIDATSMVEVAALVGQAVREVYKRQGPTLEAQDVNFDVSFLVGGQLADGELRLFQVYAAGNYIEAGPDTPYLQIGEHKYGKPILARAVRADTDVLDALKLTLISLDSTLRSNLSVGLPADVLVYHRGELRAALHHRIERDDPYFLDLSQRWSDALRRAHEGIPQPNWAAPAVRETPRD